MTPSSNETLERVARRIPILEPACERMLRRRDRKRRNQRIAAGVVGIAIFVAAVWIVTSVGSFDRTQTLAVPGGAETGPAETGPAETGPAETADRGENPEPPPLVEPVPIGTVTRSGAGCALEIAAEPIPAGPARLTVVNETNRWVSFELFRLDSRSSFAQFEAFVEAFPLGTRTRSGRRTCAKGPPWEQPFVVAGSNGSSRRAPRERSPTTSRQATPSRSCVSTLILLFLDGSTSRSLSSARSWCRSGVPDPPCEGLIDGIAVAGSIWP